MHFLFPKYIFLYIAIHLSFFTYIYLLYLEMLSIVEPYGFLEPRRVNQGRTRNFSSDYFDETNMCSVVLWPVAQSTRATIQSVDCHSEHKN